VHTSLHHRSKPLHYNSTTITLPDHIVQREAISPLRNCLRNIVATSHPVQQNCLMRFQKNWPEIEYLPPGFPSGSEEYPTIGAIAAILLTPMSRGNVTLRSASVTDRPLINVNWLTDTADTEVLTATFKRMREIWSHPSVANILVGPEIAPGSAVPGGINVTDSEILGFVKQTAQTIWHASSTCAMGGSVEKGCCGGLAGKGIWCEKVEGCR
jgi:choline dehydrogenase-like flavoprotein